MTEPNKTTVHLDDILNRFDWKNPYFVLVFLATSSIWLFAACHNSTGCSPINGTIVWEFDLNGDRARLADFSTSAYAFGSLVGALTLVRLADLKGRRPVVLTSLLLSGFFGCLASFTPNIYLFMVTRFFQGICFIGCAIDAWVLSYETAPKRLRDFSTMTFGIAWVIGYVGVAPFALFISNWRILLFICSLPCIVAAVIFYFLVPESFRYMVLNGQKEELKTFISHANKFNREKVDIDLDQLIESYHYRRQIHDDTNLLKDLFEQKKLLVYTIVLSYLWIYNTFVYYGLSLFTTDLAGNKYLNFVLLGIVEIPANIASPYLLSFLGRKFFIFSAHFLAALCFVISIFTGNSVIALILWLIGKSATVCAFNSLFVCASEVFPTVIRSGCVGICETTARLGGALSPLFHSAKGGNSNLIKYIYAITSILATICTLVFPDTSKQNLPDTTSELDQND